MERAARALQTPLVGFDLIIPDPERDPDAQTWGVIEANSLPYIDLHYLPLEGTPSNVAASVWDLWGPSRPTNGILKS
jgi:D-alanine-D-alanine ligase-like ATP-grasp enzyme